METVAFLITLAFFSALVSAVFFGKDSRKKRNIQGIIWELDEHEKAIGE